MPCSLSFNLEACVLFCSLYLFHSFVSSASLLILFQVFLSDHMIVSSTHWHCGGPTCHSQNIFLTGSGKVFSPTGLVLLTSTQVLHFTMFQKLGAKSQFDPNALQKIVSTCCLLEWSVSTPEGQGQHCIVHDGYLINVLFIQKSYFGCTLPFITKILLDIRH